MAKHTHLDKVGAVWQVLVDARLGVDSIYCQSIHCGDDCSNVNRTLQWVAQFAPALERLSSVGGNAGTLAVTESIALLCVGIQRVGNYTKFAKIG